MPELPEVETIRCDLQRLLVGKKIADIITDTPKMVKPSLKKVKAAAAGKKIIAFKRQAKLMIVELEDEIYLGIHLKMSGQLLVQNKNQEFGIKNNDNLPNKYTRVVIEFEDGDKLFFNDLRKFGWIKLIGTKKKLEKELAGYGPEPGKDLDLENFKKILASTGRAVKIAIMDQQKISGIGNIYASDALFLAKIDPRKPADELSGQEAKGLFQAINKVLQAGIKYRGASDQYYLDALGHKGHYQEHFLVYNREGEKCFDCLGEIKKIKLGGRGTYFCPLCQC